MFGAAVSAQKTLLTCVSFERADTIISQTRNQLSRPAVPPGTVHLIKCFYLNKISCCLVN